MRKAIQFTLLGLQYVPTHEKEWVDGVWYKARYWNHCYVGMLKKRGNEALLNYYFKVSPQLNEPLYTKPGQYQEASIFRTTQLLKINYMRQRLIV